MSTLKNRRRAIAGGIFAGFLCDVILTNPLNALLIAILAKSTFNGSSPSGLLVALYVPVRILLSLLPLISSSITAVLLK
jgi:hypothetical protein